MRAKGRLKKDLIVAAAAGAGAVFIVDVMILSSSVTFSFIILSHWLTHIYIIVISFSDMRLIFPHAHYYVYTEMHADAGSS